MEIKKSALSIVLSLLVSVSGLAQSAAAPSQSSDGGKAASDNSEKKVLEKKALALIDEILKEAAALRLPENRIRLQANAADLLWKHNEKRARELFKLAIDALSDLNVEAPGVQSSGWNGGLELLTQSREQLRQEILQLIAQHDGKLAREVLRSTNGSSTRKSPDSDELDLHAELGLASRIAATDPAQALQIAKESLDKGLKEELASIVQQLAFKDKAAAAELVTAIMKKLRSANLSSDRAAADIAIVLLQMAVDPDDDDSDSTEKSTTAGRRVEILDEKALLELMDMVVTAALANPPATPRSKGDDDDDDEEMPYLLAELHSMMPQIEKYAPGRVPALNKKFAEFTRKLRPETKAMIEQHELVEKGDMEGLVRAATNAPEESREDLWGQVAMKALGDGDVERARQIVVEHFDASPQRDFLLAQIDAQALQRAAEGGQLEEARQLFTRVPAEQRVAVLTQLALKASARNDKKSALQLLEEARSMVGARAANAGELGALLLIARTYTTIDPVRSFEIIEPVIDQLNTLLAAAAVLDGFEFTRYFKDGELMPQAGQSLLIAVVMQCEDDVGQFARADFDRAKAAAERFQASEVRLRARLAVAQGILSDKVRMSLAVPISGRHYGGLIQVH